MIAVERSAAIRATPAEVWSVLADFAAISAWAPTVDHACLMSGQTEGVGMARRVQVGRTTLLERVVTWEPGVTLSYVLEGLPPVVKTATNTWTIVATPDGSRVTLTTRVDAGRRPPQQLIAKVVARKLGQASDEMIAGLIARLT